MAVATGFADSPVVALRHSAPVGHFFGVPQTDDVRDAWEESVEWLCRPWLGDGPYGGNPCGAGLRKTEGEPLPGLQHLVSTMAGRDVAASTILERLRGELATLLADLLKP
jgi:hypothetical protein